jgi:hypothetical protein
MQGVLRTRPGPGSARRPRLASRARRHTRPSSALDTPASSPQPGRPPGRPTLTAVLFMGMDSMPIGRREGMGP